MTDTDKIRTLRDALLRIANGSTTGWIVTTATEAIRKADLK
jgi:hypothetical protein